MMSRQTTLSSAIDVMQSSPCGLGILEIGPEVLQLVRQIISKVAE